MVSNCGVRLLRTNLTEKDVRPKLRELVDTIFKLVPAGVGETGLLRLSFGDLDKVLDEGVDWALSKGYGWGDDKTSSRSLGIMRVLTRVRLVRGLRRGARTSWARRVAVITSLRYRSLIRYSTQTWPRGLVLSRRAR